MCGVYSEALARKSEDWEDLGSDRREFIVPFGPFGCVSGLLVLRDCGEVEGLIPFECSWLFEFESDSFSERASDSGGKCSCVWLETSELHLSMSAPN